MSQSSLWNMHTDTGDFAELCNGLYQREISVIAKGHFSSAQAVQARLKSLPYYISRTAHAMRQVVAQEQSPLSLDYQNASWAAKQSRNIPLSGQTTEIERIKIHHWYLQKNICIGLVVPILLKDHIIIDCIDRIDIDKQRVRTNVSGWFSLAIDELKEENLSTHLSTHKRLLKPNKRIMTAACTGQCWQGNIKQRPIIPTLRELLLSCSINWNDFKNL